MVKTAETSEEKKLAEERAKADATAYKYIVFFTCVAVGIVIALGTRSHVALAIPIIGLVLAYVVYFRTKESLYRKYYEEELVILQKTGGADEK